MASYAGLIMLQHKRAAISLNLTKQSFDYSLRVSKRARHVRLAVKPFVGLEVVIPKRFPRHQIDRILQQHGDWITKQLQLHAMSFNPLQLPGQIRLRLTGQDITVNYHHSQQPQLQQSGQLLTISHQQQEQALELLRQWLRRQARQQLAPRLQALADELGFSYQRVTIRSQKSRWGSCSSRGTISLNDQLMFLPADTVRYLMIHELCHTRQLNHSTAFWQLVAGCCPDYQTHEQILNRGRDLVPDWFLHSLYQPNRSSP